MGTEIEAKMKVDDLDVVRNRLRSCGAKLTAKELETNTFFDAPDRRLQKEDRGLRLRKAVDESGKARLLVTMKGPLQHNKYKTREELEFTVSDAEMARHVFHHLGYDATISFEKRRESWQLADCEVELDELPLLGQFVEIEGPSESAISEVRRRLGLEDLPLISTGYISLLSRHLQEHGIEQREIRF